MDALLQLRQKYPTLPEAYFVLLSQLGGWEGFVGDSYTVFFDAATALVASDEYQLPVHRPAYFAIGSDGGGEIIVCELSGSDDRALYHLAAIGMSDARPIEISPHLSQFAEALRTAARGGDA